MDSQYSYILLVLWGLMNSVVFVSTLIALLSPLHELSTAAKVFIAAVLVGAVTRAYGFWSGVKFSPNFWDALLLFGVTGLSTRLALRGVDNMIQRRHHLTGEITE